MILVHGSPPSSAPHNTGSGAHPTRSRRPASTCSMVLIRGTPTGVRGKHQARHYKLNGAGAAAGRDKAPRSRVTGPGPLSLASAGNPQSATQNPKPKIGTRIGTQLQSTG